MLVVNAGNRAKIVDWIAAHLPAERANRPGRKSSGTTLAASGRCSPSKAPRSVELLQPVVDVDLRSMRYYRGAQALILHPAAQRQGCIISRTGYTGEDGFELSLGTTIAPAVWEALMELGRPLGVVPAGLGARDTLRLEAGMPLYGHELCEEINPFQAGLGFACHLVGYNFPGRDALLRIQKEPPKSARIGLTMAAGSRAARPGCPILAAAGRSARSPAAPIRPRSAGRLRWATWTPTSPTPAAGPDRHPRPPRAGPGRGIAVLPTQEVGPACRAGPAGGTCRAGSVRSTLEIHHVPSGRRDLLERTSIVMPQDLLYSKTHEWLRLSDNAGGKIATVGLTAFALEMLTDLVHVELPPRGPASEGRAALRRNRVGQGRQRPL